MQSIILKRASFLFRLTNEIILTYSLCKVSIDSFLELCCFRRPDQKEIKHQGHPINNQNNYKCIVENNTKIILFTK